MMDLDTQIQRIRQFNRDYTALIGLLEKHVLDTDYTFSESRILLEIERIEACAAKDVAESLDIDPGFVSRTVHRLIQLGLVAKSRSVKDKRAFVLELTESGYILIGKLHEKANEQIEAMIKPLSDDEKKQVSASIERLNQLLLGKGDQEPGYITLRNQLKPGDMGQLIAMHGKIYSQEQGYNLVFEAYVCQTFYEALTKAYQDRDKYWLAELDGRIVGSIAIVAKDERTCQLRWLLVDPSLRGKGLGKKLFEEAMAYALEMKFTKVFLSTTTEQEQAIRFYKGAGFHVADTYSIDDWGKSLTGLTMEKIL